GRSYRMTAAPSRLKLWRRAGTLAFDREPVDDVERRDDGHAEDGPRRAEHGARGEPDQGELKAPADRGHRRGVEVFAEQPVTTCVLPDGVERQRRLVERDGVEDDS